MLARRFQFLHRSQPAALRKAVSDNVSFLKSTGHRDPADAVARAVQAAFKGDALAAVIRLLH